MTKDSVIQATPVIVIYTVVLLFVVSACEQGPQGATGPLGPQGPPGPSGQAISTGDASVISDEILWPELRIEVTLSTRCVALILDEVKYQGTASAKERQRQELEYLLAQRSRFLTDHHINRIRNWMEQINDRSRSCRDNRDALELFSEARNNNPMGRWRAQGLQAYWHCSYPDDDLLGGGHMGDIWNDSENCGAVEQWIPPSWIPAEDRP